MENLTAAVPPSASLMPLSDQQFQDMLSAWFEGKGIISDLRSQVRYKMINVLRNTVIGRDICKRSAQTVSLSKQAVNLVVAEHLMQNKYQYSLSIFNTEASLTSIFPEFGYKSLNELEYNPFIRENVLNVLELVGISKNSNICEEILALYYKETENKSLLECLITWLSEVTKLKRAEQVEINSEFIGKLSREQGDIILQNYLGLLSKIKLIMSIPSKQWGDGRITNYA